MTDARDRLRALDLLDTPDVWQRARSLEPRQSSDVDLTARNASKRVIAGVVAFAVFIAAGAFAWQVLQPAPATTPLGAPGGVTGTILWPERTEAALVAAQTRADAGDPDVVWRLDPKAVATRFAEDVMGWGGASGFYGVEVTGGSPPAGPMEVTLARVAIPCPSPVPDGPPIACPPPYAGETLTLQQAGTTGGTGVWSVTEVRASGFDLALGAGDLLNNGDTVSGHVAFPPTADAVPDFEAQSGFTVGTGTDCTSGSIGGTHEGALSIDVSVGKDGWALDSCDATSPGFAFIATASVPRCPEGVVGCIFTALVVPSLSSSYHPLYGLTAIPMLMSVLPSSSTGSPTATPIDSGTPSPIATAADQFRYLYPFFARSDGWHVHDSGIARQREGAVAWSSTVAFDPMDLESRAPAIPTNTIRALPPDGVVLTAEVVPWASDPSLGPWPPGSLDRPQLTDAIVRGPTAEEPAGAYTVYELDGTYTLIRAYFGDSAPSASALAAAQRELDTLEVPPACPIPAQGPFGVQVLPTQAAPGATLEATGLIPFQREDGSYDRQANTVIELWWDADASHWESLFADPAPTGSILVGRSGQDSCFLSLPFTLPPDATPGTHTVVAIETDPGRTWGTLFGTAQVDVTS